MDKRLLAMNLPAQGDGVPAEPCCDCECGSDCPPNCDCC